MAERSMFDEILEGREEKKLAWEGDSLQCEFGGDDYLREEGQLIMDKDEQLDNNGITVRDKDGVPGLDDGAESCSSGSSSGHIDALPNEVLLMVFSYFSLPELFSCVMPVCRRWRHLALDPSLRRTLVFSFEHKVSGEVARNLVESSPLLNTLELQSREDGGELLLVAAMRCPKLRHVTAMLCDGVDKVALEALVASCRLVTTLNLEGSLVEADTYLPISRFPHLRHLNVSHCRGLDNPALVAIANHCPHLEVLDIDGVTNIFDAAVVAVTRRVGANLKVLMLDGETLTDAAFSTLALCTRLQRLGVSFCEQMTDYGLAGVSGLTELRWLKLRKGIQLTARALRDLFITGRKRHLTHLNLGECNLMTDEVLEAIAETCPLLSTVVLHWCWDVTDAGVAWLVSCCPGLLVLDLVGVVQLTGTCFHDLPARLPHLRILDLDQCNSVQDPILENLAALMPHLKIFDYWGDPVVPKDEPVSPPVVKADGDAVTATNHTETH